MTKWLHAFKTCQERILIWLVLITPIALIESMTPMRWTDLRYQREQILGGEWWRLLTGHLDHLGWNHLALNGIFLAVCLAMFFPLHRFVNTLRIWLIASILISICMLALSPNLVWYVGLSSSLYALLIYGIVMDERYAMAVRFGFTFIVFAKVWLEQGEGQAWVSAIISGPVSELSHLYGACVGLCIACIRFALTRLKLFS